MKPKDLLTTTSIRFISVVSVALFFLHFDISSFYPLFLLPFLHSQFPGVRRFINHCRTFAQKNGFVCTLYNRRRNLPEIHGQFSSEQAQAERQATNSVVQGSAADIMKGAMLSIASFLEGSASVASAAIHPSASSRLSRMGRIVLQLHDEIILEVPEGALSFALYCAVLAALLFIHYLLFPSFFCCLQVLYLLKLLVIFSMQWSTHMAKNLPFLSWSP
jgi:hypothetical protein